MPNVVAQTLKDIQLSPTEIFRVGDRFVQPDWYEDKYVLWLLAGGFIGEFDYDLLEPPVREEALDKEQRQLIAASQQCGNCFH